jgi:uncharacterized protein involved in exopolysaccharide biosynthesis
VNSTSDVAQDVETIDLRLIFARLLERRWWVLGCILVTTAAFAAFAFLQPRVYRATVVMVPTAQERGQGSLSSALGQLGGLASLAGINVGGDSLETEEALAVMRSRQFGERFLRDRSLIPRLYPKLWDAENKKWKVEEEKRPTSAKAFRFFDKAIRSISQDKKTSLVSLQIEWTDRNEAADWANDLVRRLNAEMRERAITRASAHLGFLEKELTLVSTVETREAISRLMESQIKQRMLANVTEEFALRVIDRALPPDRDDPIRPKKLVLVVIGFLLGSIIGCGYALLSTPRKRAA